MSTKPAGVKNLTIERSLLAIERGMIYSVTVKVFAVFAACQGWVVGDELSWFNETRY